MENNNSSCDHCNLNIDTIEHHLYHCDKSRDFWKRIELWLESKIKFKYTFTICEVIFGIMNIDNNVSNSVNYINLLLSKWYINSSKINNRRIILTEFIDLLKEKLESIKLTCTLNEREKLFFNVFWTIVSRTLIVDS